MIVDNRERRPVDALQRLTRLEGAYPRNRLLRLNHGATALMAGQPDEVQQVLSPGIVARDWESGPSVLGEMALWFAHRGTARTRLHLSGDAGADLRRGLASDPRDWVRGRIHGQLGELALTAGDRDGARREFQEALRFSERGGDGSAAKDARQKLSALKR
jgi:Flp pilus assembly protein TadD